MDESLSHDDVLDVLYELGEAFAKIVSHLCASRFFALYVKQGLVVGRDE